MEGLIPQVLNSLTTKGTKVHEETLKLGSRALLSWRVVSAAGADLEVFFHGSDFDGAVASIGVEVGGLVGNVVLAAQLIFNGGKGVGDVFHLCREEGPTHGSASGIFENFVAPQDQAALV